MIKHAVLLETNQLIVNSKHNLHPETNYHSQRPTEILLFNIHPQFPQTSPHSLLHSITLSYCVTQVLSHIILMTVGHTGKLFGGILMLHNILLIYYKVLVNVNYVIKQTDEMTDYDVNLLKKQQLEFQSKLFTNVTP